MKEIKTNKVNKNKLEDDNKQVGKIMNIENNDKDNITKEEINQARDWKLS